MQSGKDMAASAKAGMDKTKATLQEKGERMTTRDPLQKEMTTERKGERIDEAERRKQEARERYAAAAGGGMFGAGGRDNTTGGELGGYDDTTDAGMGRPTEADYTVEETGGGLGRRGPKSGGGARTGYGGGNDNSLI